MSHQWIQNTQTYTHSSYFITLRLHQGYSKEISLHLMMTAHSIGNIHIFIIFYSPSPFIIAFCFFAFSNNIFTYVRSFWSAYYLRVGTGKNIQRHIIIKEYDLHPRNAFVRNVCGSFTIILILDTNMRTVIKGISWMEIVFPNSVQCNCIYFMNMHWKWIFKKRTWMALYNSWHDYDMKWVSEWGSEKDDEEKNSLDASEKIHHKFTACWARAT